MKYGTSFLCLFILMLSTRARLVADDFVVRGNGLSWQLVKPDGSTDNLSDDDEPMEVRPGDTIAFNTGNVSMGGHGVVFKEKTQAEFETYFEVLEGAGLLQANPGGHNGWGTAGINTADTPIIKVKVLPSAPTEVLPFFCSVHGQDMDGNIKVFSEDDQADHVINASSSDGDHNWQVEGVAVTEVEVKPKQVVEWKIAEGNDAAFHGLRFTDFLTDHELLTVIDEGEVGFLYVGGAQGRNPTATEKPNAQLLRIRINEDAPVGSEIEFSSIVRRGMNAKLIVVAP